MSIYTKLHEKYGNPYRVAEFRLFNLNDCFKKCESCFYQRSGNQIDKYDQIEQFAYELQEHGYQLETCYLLPTDFFENPQNFELVRSQALQNILSLFKYTGIATTLEGRVNFKILDEMLNQTGVQRIETQINLITEKLFDVSYFDNIKSNIQRAKNMLGKKIVFNLALNLGNDFTDNQHEQIRFFVNELSEDGILEINFTFLYNPLLSQEIKNKKMYKSLKSMNQLAKMYNTEEDRFNDRTILRKPAFIFKQDKVHIAPIIPFDEYVFINDARLELKSMTFDGFMRSLKELESTNQPILEDCLTCNQISTCMGKAYYAAARSYQLPCPLGV
jgi:hypothetical protein